jgi:hypothetical protein
MEKSRQVPLFAGDFRSRVMFADLRLRAACSSGLAAA